MPGRGEGGRLGALLSIGSLTLAGGVLCTYSPEPEAPGEPSLVQNEFDTVHARLMHGRALLGR